MMNKSLFELGDSKIAYYQKLIFVIGAVLLLFFTFISLNSNNKYYYYFPFIIFALFSIISFLYTKVYGIKYDSDYFYISNLFKKEKVCSSHFIKIRKVIHIDFLYIAVFKDNKSFVFMVKSQDILKYFFNYRDKHINELTQKINQTIDKKPS
jgi:hypothetical protein